MLGDSILLKIDGVTDPLRVTQLTGVERLHDGYAFDITVDSRASHSEVAALLADDLLGKDAEVEFTHETAPRIFGGVVDAVEHLAFGHRFTIVAAINLLDDEEDHRVFSIKMPFPLLKKCSPPRYSTRQTFESNAASALSMCSSV
ncbi:MAG: hypothetical protein IPK82_35965 [Polyangiaceae bacterium]|nr:hypothetical protein [Polyangiaceae bacterium]